MNAFKVHFSQFGPVWFWAIILVGSWETSTFLAFPDLARPRRLTSFNILPGIVFLYFWRGINRPQLTVPINSCQPRLCIATIATCSLPQRVQALKTLSTLSTESTHSNSNAKKSTEQSQKIAPLSSSMLILSTDVNTYEQLSTKPLYSNKSNMRPTPKDLGTENHFNTVNSHQHSATATQHSQQSSLKKQPHYHQHVNTVNRCQRLSTVVNKGFVQHQQQHAAYHKGSRH